MIGGWAVCPVCSTVVVDRAQHREWHDEISLWTSQFAAVEPPAEVEEGPAWPPGNPIRPVPDRPEPAPEPEPEPTSEPTSQ